MRGIRRGLVWRRHARPAQAPSHRQKSRSTWLPAAAKTAANGGAAPAGSTSAASPSAASARPPARFLAPTARRGAPVVMGEIKIGAGVACLPDGNRPAKRGFRQCLPLVELELQTFEVPRLPFLRVARFLEGSDQRLIFGAPRRAAQQVQIRTDTWARASAALARSHGTPAITLSMGRLGRRTKRNCHRHACQHKPT